MSDVPKTRPVSPPSSGADFAGVSSNALSRRKLYDRLAAQTVTVGGLVIIFSIIAILFVICFEALPLFQSPKIVQREAATVPGVEHPPLWLGVDEYKETAYLVLPTGIQFYSLKDRQPLPTPEGLSALAGMTVKSVSRPQKDHLMLGMADGRVWPLELHFEAQYENNVRKTTPRVILGGPLVLFEDGRPVTRHVSAEGSQGMAVVGESEVSGVLRWLSIKTKKSLMGKAARKESRKDVALPGHGKVGALALNAEGDALYLGMDSGQILKANLPTQETGRVEIETQAATSSRNIGVTALGFVFGGQTLAIGDASGKVYTYQLIRGDDQRARLKKAHAFRSHEKPVAYFFPATRDKGFLTADTAGAINYHHATSGTSQYSLRAPTGGVRSVVFSPKSDAVFATDAQGRINGWEVDNPHPETSWRTLFGKVYYEGQADSQFTWQSTGGSDDFEPKFSLTPLIFGTLKGTFYALLFAVPLALFAAFYTAQFMHPAYRNIVKPVIEIMAAVPSVVLGFFAALWLAPRIERLLPGLAIFPFLLAVLVLLGVVAFDTLPRRVKSRCKPGGEIVILMILVVVGGTAAFYIGDGIGNGPMAGDPQAWLRRVLGVSYDQRNSLVVGLAMGFAVTPLIFTISEDSLSNVPAHLKATSLALGATPWQTALRVILPTASPGIFSAVMIGFGRAVGETMIVLMATGNTPILDLNIFNGFRALAPNIAVELPEAPVDGTLYRVLFLAALILFFMTFAVNTVAEWVRLRLRERYRVL